MGKRFSDLNLGDSGPPARDDLAIARRQADRFAAELLEMEDTPMYHFAWGTIFDIRLTVQKTGRVTDGQRDAIHNIKVGAQRHEDQLKNWDKRGGSRRYEGWDDRQRKL